LRRASAGVPDLAIWCFLVAGIGLSLLALLVPTSNARSFAFDALGLVAAGGAVYGIMNNEPHRRGVWQLFAIALLLFAAGDIVFDVVQRGFGDPADVPFSDIVYLAAYPVLAIALFQLARSRFQRETAIDSAIVTVALSAVIWQWVVTPAIEVSNSPSRIRAWTSCSWS
jgi:hypothetical protein